ncbi:MAG: acyltransferase [Muribaculaceae bacterium]|nr:acyltransferase [Muribaculaceae bacterium]
MKQTLPQPAAKPRFEILDGLRGVAALTVVIFHIFEAYSPGPVYQIVNHGYLAVDFFFALSGFVIGYAYDSRWTSMSIGTFFTRRLVRLQPMVVMGSLIGALLFYFAASPICPAVEQTSLKGLAILFMLSIFLLPSPSSLDGKGWGESYSLNGPMWSLMYEYIANILYATVVRHFPKWLLALSVAASALLTVDVALNIDLFHMLENRTFQINTMIGGWSLNADQLYIGSARLLYPFFCGLLVYRLGKTISVRGAFWWCSLAVVALLAAPRIGGEEAGWQNGLYEAVAIIMVFPLIVMTGAGSKVTGKRSVKACRWLGEISYPLYLSHYPLIYIYFSWVSTHREAPLSIHIFAGIALFVISIALAQACLRLYDAPLRKWLSARLGHHRPKPEPAGNK